MKKAISLIWGLCTFGNLFTINAYARAKIIIGDMSNGSPGEIILLLLITGFIWLLWRIDDENMYINSTFLSNILMILGYFSGLLFLSILASVIFGLLF